MESRDFESIKSDLISLGFGYAGSPSITPPDPEKIIIEIIKLYPEDQKLYGIFLAWMERFGDLIHVERLSNQIDLLTQDEKVILGVTALKLWNNGDHRFKVIFDKIKKKNIRLEMTLPGRDNYLIEKNGRDKEFLPFGVTTSTVQVSENKKLMDRSFVIKNNLWLRLRVLLGANYRADMVFVKLMSLANNAYEAMKFLRCSKETSYRIWGSLEEANVEDMIKVGEAA